MKYRLRKPTGLLGGDPARGERRMEVALALRIADLLRQEPERLPG